MPMPPQVGQNDMGQTEYSVPAQQAQKDGGHAACSSITIEPGKSGGFLATCQYATTSSQGGQTSAQPEQHVFPSFEELLPFLAQELGAAPPDAQQPGPPAPPMGGPGGGQ